MNQEAIFLIVVALIILIVMFCWPYLKCGRYPSSTGNYVPVDQKSVSKTAAIEGVIQEPETCKSVNGTLYCSTNQYANTQNTQTTLDANTILLRGGNATTINETI